LPAHTATVKFRVVATLQLSVKCRLVPVLTAAGKGKWNGVLVTNPGMRALAIGEMTRSDFTASRDVPWPATRHRNGRQTPYGERLG
jgi:hypothetical protein